MNIAIINSEYNSLSKDEAKYIPKHLLKINGEYPVERIIRIAGQNGLKQAICLINESEVELKNYLLTKDFGIQLKFIIKTSANSLQSFLSLAEFLAGEPFCLAVSDCIFGENEFVEFINYSNLLTEADGMIAVTRNFNEEKPLCVAMDEEDTIFKFSDSQEGYNWALAGLFTLKPKIFTEMKNALDAGILTFRNFLRILIKSGYQFKGFAISVITEANHILDTRNDKNFFDNSVL